MRQRKAQPLNLPTIDAAYLLDVLTDAGWSQPGGMAMAPISATELQAWCAGSGTPLQPWEFGAVRAASRAYCQQHAQDDPREPNTRADVSTAPGKSGGVVRQLAAALNNRNTGS